MSGMSGDLRKLMEAAQKMQAQVSKVHEELADERFEGTAGGGAVTAVASGSGEIVEVRIDPAVLDPADPELVGDLVVAAVNLALRAVQDATTQAVGGAMGMDPGSLGGLLGG